MVRIWRVHEPRRSTTCPHQWEDGIVAEPAALFHGYERSTTDDIWMHRSGTRPGANTVNVERFRKLQEVLGRRQPDLTVLMERVHKSHNLSAILRNCDAAGVLQAHAIPPKGGLDIHPHTSAGTSKWVKVVRHRTVQAATEHLRAEGFQILAAHPGDGGAVDYRDVNFTAPTAIMVGAELLGLTDDALAMADQLVEIPMLGMASSLNVSVATALLLFEAASQRTAARMYETSRLPRKEFERILFEWAYPRVSRKLREDGRPYPTLDAAGDFHL